jgi:hypothetical protein
MEKISETINNFDIGLYLLDPACFNDRMALPNKVFEFVQGRLMIAVWPSPEMARIVRDYGLGIVSDEFNLESMARMLNGMGAEQIMAFKNNSHLAARELSSETNRLKFLKNHHLLLFYLTTPCVEVKLILIQFFNKYQFTIFSCRLDKLLF